MHDLNGIWTNPGLQGVVRNLRDRVDRSGGPNACWPWTGARHTGGYGQIGVHDGAKQQMVYTHRAAYILANGPIPEHIAGQRASVLHHCDNPPCCNPKHLFLGNTRINMADKVAKDRQLYGSDNGMAKLNEVKVRAILASTEPDVVLTRRYDVSPMLISKIRRGQLWKHVNPGAQRIQPHPRNKLTEFKVREILASNDNGPTLARRYDVSVTTINRVRQGRTWPQVARAKKVC